MGCCQLSSSSVLSIKAPPKTLDKINVDFKDSFSIRPHCFQYLIKFEEVQACEWQIFPVPSQHLKGTDQM